MTQCIGTRNPLQRDGTSQSQRRLAALDPASAPVDARGVADFLEFARLFSRRVVYFDLENSSANDWESFFLCDASVLIASIQKTNPLPLREDVRDALTGPAEPERLGRLFTLLISLARQIDFWYLGVGTATDFRDKISKRIRANLSTTLPRLAAYEKAAAARFLGTVTFTAADYAGFSDAWSLPDLSEVTPDFSLFGAFDAVEDQIRAARRRLEALFVPLYNVLLEIIGLAPGFFEEDLTARRDHEPHLALFIAFLRLYLRLRDDANLLTQKHLDFFYEKVLGITRKPAEPDHVHVLVELARQVTEDYRLSGDTKLDAGKDETGIPLRFALDDDLVANKAQIESIKTVFVAYDRAAPGFPEERIIENVHAAPVANSQDGLGAEIEDPEEPSWSTLGGIDMPEATLGLLVASQALLLAEGTRTITLDLHAANVPADLGAQLPSHPFGVLLSGEKGWLVPDEVVTSVVNVTSADVGGVTVHSATIRLEITLESTAEPVTGADAKALGEDYGTTDPVLKLTLVHPPEGVPTPYVYGVLKTAVLQRITLGTTVEGLTSVIVQNDQFAADPTKPFEPFGSSPRMGSHFYVGSAEAFEKNLTRLTLNVAWDLLPATFARHYEGYDVAQGSPAAGDFRADSAVLQDGEWLPVESKQLFVESGGALQEGNTLSYSSLGAQEPRILAEFAEWTPATQHGFLRLTLNPQAFYHDAFVNVLTRQALAAARVPKETVGARYRLSDDSIDVGDSNTADLAAGTEVIIPNAPYTPTIKAFAVDYEASVDTETSPDALALIHIEPFGYRRVSLPTDAAVADAEAAGRTDVEKPHLLPQIDHEGTLYLGISGLKPLQSLSILFQVAEATADTEVRKPEVTWAYLAGDQWVDFEDYEITADTTHGLIASGIVTFTIPRGITEDVTRLPSGLSWLRASVDVDAGGVSETIDAHTQAVRATFVEQDNDPARLATPLPAGSVTGLVEEDANVAGVEQPYDSFGGRTAETGEIFYTRVAEHLRHKGRAITLFDYERLVLERFPSVYKVKCINHTNDRHELAPGHVLVAVIPDFTQLKAARRRTPKVTLDDLDAISSMLQAVNCPFVRNDRTDGRDRLHVLNPVYEEVRVAFKVRFREDVTALGFYRRELNSAINRFLSPWAFEDGAEVAFGGKVYKSSILNFVEEQQYVDFVTDFAMTHLGGSEDVDFIEAETPRSILVPAETHGIEVLDGPHCMVAQPLFPRGIGQMTVNTDFEVYES